MFSDGVEGEFREPHVRLTFREAVQLFEHRSQFIRRSSNACLVTKLLYYLLYQEQRWAGKCALLSVRNSQCSRSIFFHVSTVTVSFVILHVEFILHIRFSPFTMLSSSKMSLLD